jgi:hypothetical protein
MAAALVFAAAEKFAVDDFASGKVQASSGGWWYTYNDLNTGGNSEVTPAPDKFAMAKDGDKFAARMQGKVGNKLGWDFVGLGVTLGENCGCPGKAEPVDLSKYTTLTLRIKGSITGGRLVLNLPYSESKCDSGKTNSLTEWADYEFALNSKLAKDWTVVKIDLRKDFKQPKWAKVIVPIEKVLQNAHNLNFHFSSPDGDSVDVQVDQIEFN